MDSSSCERSLREALKKLPGKFTLLDYIVASLFPNGTLVVWALSPSRVTNPQW